MNRKSVLTIFVSALLPFMLAGCSLLKKGDSAADSSDSIYETAPEATTDAVPEGTSEQTASSEADNAGQEAAPEAAPDAAQASADSQEAQPSSPATEAVASAPVPASGEGYENYTVQQGETLMKIAFETYGDLYKWKDIYAANRDRINNPSAIPAGTVLRIEKAGSPVTISRNGEKYLIKWGDTLGTVSDDVYGTRQKWKRLWENNRELIRDPNRIFAGFYLYYTMTDQDRQELEQYRKPLAQGTTGAPVENPPREPASLPAPPQSAPAVQ